MKRNRVLGGGAWLGFAAGAAQDLAGIKVEGVGSILRFPKLDAGFTISRLLEALLGPRGGSTEDWGAEG
jgi:hypothetical protein